MHSVLTKLQACFVNVFSSSFFDSFEPVDPAIPTSCICGPDRALRPFNCRAFPYAPTVEGKRVVGVHRNSLKYLEPCWIERPGFDWAHGAVQAWQVVLDDDACRVFFARMALMWEWSLALDRGEEPGPVLSYLAQLNPSDPQQSWAIAPRFFSRTDAVP
jgi:hypothetical protein